MPHKTPEIVAFVHEGSRRLTLAEFNRLHKKLPTIRARIEALRRASDIPNLAVHLDFLCDVLDDSAAGRFDAVPYHCLAAVAFALGYFLRDVDVIPDFVPGIGLVDDATVVLIVLRENEAALRKHPSADMIDWQALHA